MKQIVMKIAFYLGIILLVALTLFPRSIEVLTNNQIFLFDQGRDYLAAYDIAQNHNITLIGSEVAAGQSGISYVFHGPGYYYLLALSSLVSHGDPYAGLVLMYLFSIGSVILGFYLGYKIFGKWGGLLLALLISVSPPLISQARFVWNPHPATFFILLLLSVLYMGKERSLKILAISSFLCGFLYNFDLAISLPIVISYILYAIFVIKIRRVKEFLVVFLGLILSFSPMILFEAKQKFPATKNIVAYLLGSHASSSGKPGTNYFINHLEVLKYNFTDTFPKNMIPEFLLMIVLIGFAIFFLTREKEKKLKHLYLFILSIPVVTFIFFLPFRNALYPHFLIAENIVYIFLFAYVLISAYKKTNYVALVIFGIYFAVFLVMGTLSSYTTSIKDYGDYGGFAKTKGKTAILDYIYKDAKGKKFNVLVFTPPVYTYPYDYLFKTYGKNTYGYEPGNTKEGLTYLIMEKDNTKPTSYQGWLTTVIKSGTVISTKEFLPGLLIQKRDFK